MIDWVSGIVYLPHSKPLLGGAVAHIDKDDNGKPFISRQFYKKEVCEGSYSSKFQVSTLMGDDYQEMREEQYGESGISPTNFIQFSGNPAKFLQGHNVFGVTDLNFLVFETLKKCFISINKEHWIPQLKESIYGDKWSVTRVDITKMLKMDSHQDVDQYIYLTSKTSHIRSGNIEYDKNTLYFGKNSIEWSVKLYNKFKEISSRKKAHRMPDDLAETGLKQWVKGQLRVELVLRKPALIIGKNTTPSILQKNLNELFSDYIGRITMKKQHKIDDVMALPKKVRSSYLLWLRGIKVKTVMSSSTYYAHRDLLLVFGIDLNNPPLCDGDSNIDFIPLARVLEPREITIAQIPEQFLPLLAQPESNLRRVA